MPVAELGPRYRRLAQTSTARLVSRRNSGGAAGAAAPASPTATGLPVPAGAGRPAPAAAGLPMPPGASWATLPEPCPATATPPVAARRLLGITLAGGPSSSPSSRPRRRDSGQAGLGSLTTSVAGAGAPGLFSANLAPAGPVLAGPVPVIPPVSPAPGLPGPGFLAASARPKPTTGSLAWGVAERCSSSLRLIASSAAAVGTSDGMPPPGRLPGGAGSSDLCWPDGPRAGRRPENRRPRGRASLPASASSPAGAALASGAGRPEPPAPASSVLNAPWSSQ